MKVSQIKIINIIQTEHRGGINSICLLKDKRIVSSGSKDGLIIVFNRLYQPQFYIKRVGSVYSLYVLRSGELLTAGYKEIKVWRVDEDDYHLIYILKGHNDSVNKVIEMKDGKLCSCSFDGTINIWDNYKCIQTLKGNTNYVESIIETNNYIVSISSYYPDYMRVWDKTTYQSIAIIYRVGCRSDGISKLDDNTLILGGVDVIILFDINTYQINRFENDSLGEILCFSSNGKGLAFIGNKEGEIICYDLSSNKIILENKFRNRGITCLKESEDNKLISSTNDNIINICIISYK